MPELPEVETIRSNLEPLIVGKKIAHVNCRRWDIRFPIPSALPDALESQTIVLVARRAKYILITFDNNLVLILHLGMSGRIRYESSLSDDYQLHDHVVFALTDGSGFIFNDPRRFGVVDLTTISDLSNHKLLKDLGPEPLHIDLTADAFFARINSRRKPIKLALMDNHIIVGVGNIYASESLHIAGIHPERFCDSLNLEEATRLLLAIQQVLRLAIDAGGSTLKDYSQVSGESGYFQHQFKVYEQEGQPCLNCKQSSIERLVMSGRSTYFCPQCQPQEA